MELLREIIARPAVAIALTVGIFAGAQWLQRRWSSNPLLNPTLLAVVIIIVVLRAAGVPCAKYQSDTQVISFLLAPTVVCLAVPIYRCLPLIRVSRKIIGSSLLIGAPVGVGSAVAIATVCGAKQQTTYSLAPKSVTAGIAIGISSSIGGIPALTAALVIATGIVGAAFGPWLLHMLRVRDERAIGLAIGIGSHGIGTARAFQISERVGAFSGLAMALNGVVTAFALPLSIAASRRLHWGASQPLSREAAVAVGMVALIAVSAVGRRLVQSRRRMAGRHDGL